MPYDNGVRITQDEYIRRKRIREGRDPEGQQFHTGPDGENPASAPDIDPETEAPKAKRKAGSRRSSKSASKVKAAIATATGTDLPDITGLDAGTEEGENA